MATVATNGARPANPFSLTDTPPRPQFTIAFGVANGPLPPDTALNGRNGFSLVGATINTFAVAVAGGGDFDGDGKQDLAVTLNDGSGSVIYGVDRLSRLPGQYRQRAGGEWSQPFRIFRWSAPDQTIAPAGRRQRRWPRRSAGAQLRWGQWLQQQLQQLAYRSDLWPRRAHSLHRRSIDGTRRSRGARRRRRTQARHFRRSRSRRHWRRHAPGLRRPPCQWRRCHRLSGPAPKLPASIDPGALTGANGFRITGAARVLNRLGRFTGGARDDLAIVLPNLGIPGSAGAVQVYRGRAGSVSASINPLLLGPATPGPAFSRHAGDSGFRLNAGLVPRQSLRGGRQSQRRCRAGIADQCHRSRGPRPIRGRCRHRPRPRQRLDQQQFRPDYSDTLATRIITGEVFFADSVAGVLSLGDWDADGKAEIAVNGETIIRGAALQ